MKVLFLDIDGVLNSLAFLQRVHCGGAAEGAKLRRYAPEVLIDVDAVARLNEVIKRSGAVCVVSSAWRVVHSLERLERALRFRGFIGTLIGSTNEEGTWVDHDDRIILEGFERHTEITDWLNAHHHQVEAFAVVDDMEMGPLSRWHVQTDFDDGLLDHHVPELLQCFERPR